MDPLVRIAVVLEEFLALLKADRGIEPEPAKQDSLAVMIAPEKTPAAARPFDPTRDVA